jgi:quercetin dioxygenase-like cupin family protein
MFKRTRLGLAVLASLALAGPLSAQQDTVHRTPLQDTPFPNAYHSVLMKVVIDKGGATPSHSHPGLEMGYVMDGKAELVITGQPARTITNGDSFAVPANTAHKVTNTGPGALTILSTYVVDKDKPIVNP